MNYAPSRPAPECIACGRELTESEDLDLSGVACNSCFSESEAKALAAKYTEAVSQFRWTAGEWFLTGEIAERMPFMSRLQFGRY